MSYTCISVEDAQKLIEAGGATLLDIRDPGSFSEGHVQNAMSASDENIEERLDKADKEKPMIVYCYHGNSSKGAADYFFNQGFTQSYSVDGGFEEWKSKL